VKVFLIGVGRAGCRIGSLFLKDRALKSLVSGMLVDTDRTEIEHSSYKYSLLVGEKLLDGNGTGKELETGTEVLESERYYIMDRLATVKKDVDCFFVVSSMGGGTGGAAHVIIEELKRSYEEPVYYVGLLPSLEDREDILSNYAKSLKKFVKHSDALFPIDMDGIRGERGLRGSYGDINAVVFNALSDLFEIGTYLSRDEVGGNIVGTSEVINTLTGISTIGIQSFDPGKKGGNNGLGKNADKPDIVLSMTKKASKNVLLPFELEDANKALVIVSGPKKYLDFIGSIPARLWVEEHIGKKAVLGGDAVSTRKKDIEVITVFSRIKRSDRIKDFYERGEMLGKRLEDERISVIVERIGNINSKLASLEKDFNKTAAELRGMIKDNKKGR